MDICLGRLNRHGHFVIACRLLNADLVTTILTIGFNQTFSGTGIVSDSQILLISFSSCVTCLANGTILI